MSTVIRVLHADQIGAMRSSSALPLLKHIVFGSI